MNQFHGDRFMNPAATSRYAPRKQISGQSETDIHWQGCNAAKDG